MLARLAQLSTPIRIKGYGNLTYPICAVVQLAHQPPGVIHQCVLDPAKAKAVAGEIAGRTPFLIRIGEWPGDQVNGWQYVDNVLVLATLGRATLTKCDGTAWEGSEADKAVTVTPEEEKGVS